jgi:hypothetical protein
MINTEDQSQSPEATQNPTVAAVNLKIPPFWPADPLIWFAQVEAQFATRGITQQKTKYDYIIASLSPEYAMEVRDLILDPPSTSPYTTLKEQLVRRTAASEQRRLQQLLNSEDLGDHKPTQVLRHMQQLLGDKFSLTDASFLRELFLQRLPSNVRMVLATIESDNLETLAQTADKIMEVASPSNNVYNVNSHSPSTPEVTQLRSEVQDLRKLIDKLISTTRPPRARSPRPRPASSPSAQQSDICWYHQRFGANAQKCRPPCSESHSGNGQASN